MTHSCAVYRIHGHDNLLHVVFHDRLWKLALFMDEAEKVAMCGKLADNAQLLFLRSSVFVRECLN